MTCTHSSQAPRVPDADEKMDLVVWLAREQGHTREDAADLVRTAFIAVYDSYCTDCRGYAGRLMSVVWCGDPSAFDVFTWDGDDLVCRDRDQVTRPADR